MAGGDSQTLRDTMAADKKDNLNGFGSKAVHSGTNHIGDAVNTPIFQSSTYKLTDERYAGWAAGAQHTLLYARLSTVNSDAVAQKLTALETAKMLRFSPREWQLFQPRS